MERALDYMIANAGRRLRIEEVAALEGVEYHPSYFAEVFQEYFDMPWRSFYLKLKMRNAARFIQDERLCVNLAKRYGYADARKFNKNFTQEIGMTPAEFLEADAVVPDMPERKQLCGTPIRMAYVNNDEFTIYGLPLYHPAPQGYFDRLKDAAYALTCVPAWKDKLQGFPYVGIWSYDQKGRQYYLIGSVTENPDEAEEGSPYGKMIRQDIGGGQYAVFSAPRTQDDQKNTEISRMLARYAMMEWRKLNCKETDRLGFTFERFDEDRVYLFLPLLGDYGNNDHWRKSMQASLYREYIDAHITQEIRTSEYARKVYYSERWLRDSFRQLYGMPPQKYIDIRRLKLAGKELNREGSIQEEILEKYHFSSLGVFSRKFISQYGVSYREYSEPEIILPESIPVRYGKPRKIKVSILNLPPMRTILHPLTTVPEMMEVGDYPGLVTYWFTHEWQESGEGYNRKDTGNVDKIFLYDIHLFQEKNKKDLEYSIGMILPEEEYNLAIPEGYRGRTLEGGRYVRFEVEGDYEQKELMEIYQQMEASIFLKWYYENELLISTIREKLIRYKDGKLYFFIPLEV